ncbi:MAG TPA: enoyl-CoA hydratase [Candidatus Binatia bacterium]|nr:enoyl-CoA hydratase [Candidatus Binatia bacterium]
MAEGATAKAGGGSEPALRIEGQGGVLRLVLDRPAQRNALSAELLGALEAALRDAARDPAVRAIVIAGNGPAFSAGHDLREIANGSSADTDEVFRRCSIVMQLLHEVPQPTVARVHGIATAAGCQLVAACDLAVAAASATFATPGVRIGLFCSTPAVPLVRAIGRKRALEMLFTGAPIDARTALEWGLVNRVVPDVELDRSIDELVAPILAASAHAVALGKQTFYRQVDRPEHEAYEVASETMCVNAADDDAHEGIAAFLGKRSPTWKRR